MRADGLPLFGFAAAVLAFDALLWSYDPSLLVGLLLLAPATAAVLAGIAVARRRGRSDAPRAVPDLSLPTMLCALALATCALAAIFGLWLFLVGLGLGALATGGIVRELRESSRRHP